jgi:four helix bundle protein
MSDFYNLQVWHKAHALVLDVYRATGNFPKREMFGLTDQMRRSSASIATNIAEGCGRSSQAELVRFLKMSQGSAKELEYQELLARDLGYLGPTQYSHLVASTKEVQRMLSALIQRLRQPASSSTFYLLPST